ncbi:Hypothetical protein FKW44_022280, partial [Caligus rogercresseyi]
STSLKNGGCISSAACYEFPCRVGEYIETIRQHCQEVVLNVSVKGAQHSKHQCNE